MAEVALFSEPKTVTVTHYPELKAVHATWISFSTPKAREAAERYVRECGRVGALTLIVDLTGNPGVPSQSDLEWIETRAVELTRQSGVRAVVNLHGASAIASMGPKRWNKSATDGGLTTYDCRSLADALALAADVAAGRAA